MKIGSKKQFKFYLEIRKNGSKQYLLTPLEYNSNCIGEWTAEPDQHDVLVTKHINLYKGHEHLRSFFTQEVLCKIGGGLIPEIG
jgi:hypothetical protein